ncbi:MAG: rhodanese-related sulfurtransferase [Candidatus Woesearchaeota archaeon]
MYNTITFYKFVKINPDKIRDIILEKCKELNILGRILIGKEGINGGICSDNKSIEKFKKWLKTIKEFNDITFRELESDKNTYHKLVVRVRKEIVVLGKEVDMKNKADYITPAQLNKLYEKNEDFIILDTRNKYEADVGKFRNAKIMDIKTFKQFPDELKKLKKEISNKKIITYCTGGIRCEKATAYMKQIGINNVLQLKGGVIDYMNKYPNKYWEGGLFVFDDRLVTKTANPLTECKHCGKKCETYINCHNLNCDKLFICCDKCRKMMNSCCSNKCKQSPRQRKPKYIKIGIIKNYYGKNKVAFAEIEHEIIIGTEIKIKGKTTDFIQKIRSIKDEKGQNVKSAKGLITFKVDYKTRKNDQIMISP